MKSWKLVFFLTLGVSVMASTVFGAAGAILVDEDFEDDEPFTELNWPIFDITSDPQSRPPQPQELLDWQGYEVRADSLASTLPMNMTNKITPVASAVTISTDRFFTRSQSLCLNSNSTTPSSAILSPANQPGQSPTQWASFQVAVSVNASTPLDPWPAPGTEVGKITWDTRIRTQVAEKPHRPNATYTDILYDILLVTNSSTTIDIISVDPADDTIETKIGELEGGVGNWAMISILQMTDVADVSDEVTTDTPTTAKWVCYDLGNQTDARFVYIGPQPPIPYHFTEPEFAGLGLDLYPDIISGVHIFVNSDSPAISYLPNDIYDGLTQDGAYGAEHGMLQDGYVIEAASGEMDLYIDDLFYSVGGHDDPEVGVNGITLAQAARLQPFTGVIEPGWSVPTETPPLSVRPGWNLYE